MAESAEQAPPDGGSRPVPDPTILTTALIDRAVRSERERIDAQLKVLEERLRGIDEATKLRLVGVEGIPHQIAEQVDRLESLVTEKFASIQLQFQERDVRSERESRDNTKAVDAAFAAQKEAAAKQDESNQKAIDKSEAATSEKITKLEQLFQTTTDALKDNLSDLKLAVGQVVTAKVTTTENRTGMYLGIGAIAAIIAVGIAIIGIIASKGGP